MFQQLLCSLLIYVDSLNKSLDYIFFSINNIKIYIRIYNRWSLYRLLSSNAGNSNNVLNANSDGNLNNNNSNNSNGVRPLDNFQVFVAKATIRVCKRLSSTLHPCLRVES